MPLHHAVLALLSDGPGYGYELKTQFEEAIGPQWGGLNIGHLYQILDRLERDGYVAPSRVSQSSRPDKTLYTLTAAGEEELRGWATQAWVRTSGFRDELFLKLLGASRLGGDALTELLAAQRSACLSDIGALTRLRAKHSGEALIALLIDAAIAHLKADLQVVDSAAARLTPGVPRASSTGQGAATENAPAAGHDAAS